MGEENVLLFGREKKKKKKKKMWNTITSKNNPKYKKIIVLVDCNRFVSLREKKRYRYIWTLFRKIYILSSLFTKMKYPFQLTENHDN